jgi:hypothetical protein
MFPPDPAPLLRSLAAVAAPETLRLLWRIVLRRWRPKRLAKSGLLRCCGSKGGQGLRAKDHRTEQFKRLFFDTGQRRLSGW